MISVLVTNGKERNRFGLTDRDMTTIQNILGKYPEVETMVVFGSRAMGTHKPGSDVDLAIMDAEVDDSVLCKLINDFSDSCLPYFVDLVCYAALENPELKEHIDSVGIPFPRPLR
ncbi:MAG: nucleotidyltransferase domain-containing protein [Desulfuromonas sp.]|nr:nucleotidyltransferase domain-containing protein [Desulfuromonas sp.]